MFIPANNNYSVDPFHGGFVFDDFISGNTNNGYPIGSNFRQTGNNGGGNSGGVSGSDATGVANRVGLCQPFTGTSANSTGQGIIDCTTFQTYCGQGDITLKWAAKIGTLSTSTIGYTIEMGFGNGYAAGGTGNNNAAFIQYKSSLSPQFSAVTGNNGTQTTLTTGAAAPFTVNANTWYNFKIRLYASGTQADFWVATPGGGNFILLGTSNTNLPDITHQCNPVFQIYKTTNTAASSSFIMDWARFDYFFNTMR